LKELDIFIQYSNNLELHFIT